MSYHLVSDDPDVLELALRLARQCRRVVQCCLREEEWAEADREFAAIIAVGLLGRDTGSHGIPDDSGSSEEDLATGGGAAERWAKTC